MDEDKIQVLIADDEDPLRMTIAAWLRDEGFEVEEVGDGIEAIKKTQAKDYDIALLDIKMPGANGLEVLRYVKKNSGQTEIVMMTGMSDVSMAVEAMKLGAKEYLTKPGINQGLCKCPVSTACFKARASSCDALRNSVPSAESVAVSRFKLPMKVIIILAKIGFI